MKKEMMIEGSRKQSKFLKKLIAPYFPVSGRWVVPAGRTSAEPRSEFYQEEKLRVGHIPAENARK